MESDIEVPTIKCTLCTDELYFGFDEEWYSKRTESKDCGMGKHIPDIETVIENLGAKLRRKF